MSRISILTCAAICTMLASTTVSAGSRGKSRPKAAGTTDPPRIAIVLQHYTGSRGGTDISSGPAYLYDKVVPVLRENGAELADKAIVKLTPAEEKEYGVWHRVGLANGHLGRTIAPGIKRGNFTLGLLGNCNSLWGMLAGLQHSGPTRRPLKVGLIWMDAHGDYNTPETTLSGMLGGMPVAVAAGKCLFRLRLKAGLDPAISTRHIVMMGLRDVDPLEQVLIDESHITCISTAEMVARGKELQEALAGLSRQVDAIYVHIDLDVLDAADIPGHTFEISGGPSAGQLAETLRFILRHPKVKALGIASFPMVDRGRARSLESTLTLIRGAVQGLKERSS